MLMKLLLPVVFFCALSDQQRPAQKAIHESAAPMPKGRYAVLVRDSRGTTYDVRIFAPHEKVKVDRDLGGEFRGEGKKYYTGTYQVALRHEGASKHRVQRIPLFGYETTPNAEGRFTPWNKRVFVLKGKTGQRADLLLIAQFYTLGTNHVRAFFVQNGVLVPVVWRVSSKETTIGEIVGKGEPMKGLHGNIYQTVFYSNGEDTWGYHILTWRFEPKGRRMVLLREELTPDGITKPKIIRRADKHL
jgi:hypothetical protein